MIDLRGEELWARHPQAPRSGRGAAATPGRERGSKNLDQMSSGRGAASTRRQRSPPQTPRTSDSPGGDRHAHDPTALPAHHPDPGLVAGRCPVHDLHPLRNGRLRRPLDAALGALGQRRRGRRVHAGLHLRLRGRRLGPEHDVRVLRLGHDVVHLHGGHRVDLPDHPAGLRRPADLQRSAGGLRPVRVVPELGHLHPVLPVRRQHGDRLRRQRAARRPALLPRPGRLRPQGPDLRRGLRTLRGSVPRRHQRLLDLRRAAGRADLRRLRRARLRRLVGERRHGRPGHARPLRSRDGLLPREHRPERPLLPRVRGLRRRLDLAGRERLRGGRVRRADLPGLHARPEPHAAPGVGPLRSG